MPTGTNSSRTNSVLGAAIAMKRQALQQKIKELGIDPDAYRHQQQSNE